MIIKQAKYILGVAAVCGFLSCTKDLDLRPTDAIDASKAFTSVKDLTDGLYGVYSSVSNANRIRIGSILADETKLSDENRGQDQTTFRWQYTSNNAPAGLGQYYQTIDRIHRIIAAAPGIPAANATEDAAKTRINAELLGLRGIAYYELLILFSPQGYAPDALAVPLVLSSDLLQKPARAKVSEIVAQIETDLTAARASASIPDAPTDPLRLSKSAIAAYQARVALYKRAWPAAITFASDAISLSGKTLNKATLAGFFSDANESETIFKYRNNAGPSLIWRDTNGDVFFEPADKLKQQFDRVNDVRFAIFFGAGGNDTSIVIKYPGSSRGPQVNDLKLVRLAEMYLLRAEAYAENNQLPQAAADVNALLAQRVNGHVDLTYGTRDLAIAGIMNERFKELCFEGFRFFDLKRKGLAITRNLSDSRNANWQTMPANDTRFALPIPQTEIFANPNMVQNTGY